MNIVMFSKVVLLLVVVALSAGNALAAGTTIQVLFPDAGFEGGTINQKVPTGNAAFPPTNDTFLWRFEAQTYTNVGLPGSGIVPHGGSRMMAFTALGSSPSSNADMYKMIDLRDPGIQALINTGNVEVELGGYFNRETDSLTQSFYGKNSAVRPFMDIRFYASTAPNAASSLGGFSFNPPNQLPVIGPIPADEWTLISFIGNGFVPLGAEFAYIRIAMHEAQPAQTVRGTYVDDVFLTLFTTGPVQEPQPSPQPEPQPQPPPGGDPSSNAMPEPSVIALTAFAATACALRRRRMQQ